ncbi:hypothetical protein [Paracoccus aerodenitrificans]|uniref:hypothetical protein n=1 Tax=Paracoccus aerodenitrificans TaxID=3017781 RepID=UPI0022EFF89F|nr:hypothetical protein [Paracoccus aerodenitrificans]WBU62803.1 hypothetical protein PAE61_10490 [Paracoccus aerodenitrificans]
MPDEILLKSVLRNATELLASAAEDAERLQLLLTEAIDPDFMSPDGHGSIQILQSLDPLTQTLIDIATAFRILSEKDICLTVTGWEELIETLKLERVGKALTCGMTGQQPSSHVDIF